MALFFLIFSLVVLAVVGRKPAQPCEPNGDDCAFKETLGALDPSKWLVQEYHNPDLYMRLSQYKGKYIKGSSKKKRTTISMAYEPSVHAGQYVPFSSGDFETSNRYSVGCYTTKVKHSLVYG